jgi:GPH family glycoside/pentoside/hexuronide:cation symporter
LGSPAIAVRLTPEDAALALPSAAPRLVPSKRVKAIYALGQVAQSGGFEAAIGFIFFYYTAVLGLSGSLVGAALAISLAFDAVVDPVIGSISDNVRSRLGRRLPVMIAAIPFVVVSIGLLFSPPTQLAPMGLFAWLTVTSIAVRSAISAFNVPYIALGAELADGYTERSSVVAYRTMVGIFSNVAVIAVAFTVFFSGPGGLLRRGGYPGLGWTVALFILAGTSLCCAGMARHAAGLPRAVTAPGALLKRLPRELREIFANPSFRLLFASLVIFYVSVGANAALGSHVAIFVWKLPAALLQFTSYAVLFGVLVGVPVTPLLQRRLEKKTVVNIGLGMIIVSWVVLPILRVAGAFTLTGAAVLAPLCALAVFGGVGVGLAVIAYPSMMADAADEHELMFGSRREGLYFAGLGFAAKAANGVGVLVAGFALDLIGFPSDASHHPGLVLSEPLLRRLVLGWGPLPALFGIASMVVLAGYKISRSRHDEIRDELRTAGAAT